jgi:hypothetical protein
MKKKCYFCGTEVECIELPGGNDLERMECEINCQVFYKTTEKARRFYFEKKDSVLTKEDKDLLLKYANKEFIPGQKVPLLSAETIYKLTGKRDFSGGV